MRIERSITTISWSPSDLLEGMGKVATRMKMAHHDPPPPDSLERTSTPRSTTSARPTASGSRTSRAPSSTSRTAGSPDSGTAVAA